MRHALKFALLATSLLTATTVNAAWPERPVTIVVPFTAGGITDVLARLTAERLHAAFKQIYIPISDVVDVRKSLFGGYAVRFKRPHGLLNGFVIHRLFGDQAEPLANAIREEIRRRAN